MADFSLANFKFGLLRKRSRQNHFGAKDFLRILKNRRKRALGPAVTAAATARERRIAKMHSC